MRIDGFDVAQAVLDTRIDWPAGVPSLTLCTYGVATEHQPLKDMSLVGDARSSTYIILVGGQDYGGLNEAQTNGIFQDGTGNRGAKTKSHKPVDCGGVSY